MFTAIVFGRLRSFCSVPFSSWREFVRKNARNNPIRTVHVISAIVQNQNRRQSLKLWLAIRDEFRNWLLRAA
jgi:hypothetical protein